MSAHSGVLVVIKRRGEGGFIPEGNDDDADERGGEKKAERESARSAKSDRLRNVFL